MAEHPQLFVSHSSRDNELTRELCTALAKPADPAQPAYTALVDFDLLVDYDALVAGQAWPKQLHEWMARCNAAVILLTENAVTSPWVLKEATILAWRNSIQDHFHLFTVRFPGVTDDVLTSNKFDPLALGNIQEAGAGSAGEIAQTIRDTLGSPPAALTPFEELVGRLSDLFARVGDNTLKAVATKVRVGPPAWRPDRDLRQQYTEEIARQILTESLGSYQGVSELIDELSTSVGTETVRKIFHIAAPFWVDAEAAGKLPPLTEAQPRRAAAMNGVEVSDFTARMYMRRAHPLSRLFSVIPAAGGQAGCLVEHYTNEICSFIRRRKNSKKDNEAIIADLARRKPSYYVVLPQPLPDPDSLQQLLDRFPKLTFILWTGEHLERDDTVDRAVWLEPEVDLQVEEDQFLDWESANEILQNMNA